MKVKVGESPVHGLGVFAIEPIEATEIIEVAPVLLVPESDLPMLDRTVLYDFYYGWPTGAAIALGYGSLYNHSAQPNADYVKDPLGDVIRIVALERIEPGDEVLVDYSRGGTNPLWFEPRTEPASPEADPAAGGKPSYTDVIKMLDRLTVGVQVAAYSDAEAAQIRETLESLTVAQIKERFVGYGVRASTFSGMRKSQMIDFLIDSMQAMPDGTPRVLSDGAAGTTGGSPPT